MSMLNSHEINKINEILIMGQEHNGLDCVIVLFKQEQEPTLIDMGSNSGSNVFSSYRTSQNKASLTVDLLAYRVRKLKVVTIFLLCYVCTCVT